MACRQCGADVAPGAWACPVCERRLRPWLAELAVLTGPRARARALWRTLQARGPLAWYARCQLYDLEIQLAFRNWHVARGEQPPAALGAWTPAQYRARIAAVRRRIAAEGLALPLGPPAA